MSNIIPSELFTRFVKFVELEHPCEKGPLTVSDLRLAIRKDRLTEISVWTFEELDDVEKESLLFGEDTVLMDLLSAEQPVLQTTGAQC